MGRPLLVGQAFAGGQAFANLQTFANGKAFASRQAFAGGQAIANGQAMPVGSASPLGPTVVFWVFPVSSGTCGLTVLLADRAQQLALARTVNPAQSLLRKAWLLTPSP